VDLRPWAWHITAAKYDSHVEVNAYDMDPVAKCARNGRRKSAVAVTLMAAEPAQQKAEPDEDRLAPPLASHH
jgi:hypothetical protein